jgi:hypothetical protein
MAEICSILGGLLLVILLVAVIGHVFWLCLAAIFRLVTGRDARAESPQPHVDESGITAKKLQQLYREARIDLPTFQKILSAMNESDRGHRPVLPLAHRPQQPPPPTPTPQPPQQKPREDIALADEWAPTQPPPLPPPPLPFAQVAPIHFTPPPPPKFVAPIAPLPPPPPRAPRKPFSEILKHFMEESNIRWGELIGGLLIIGCSIALVLTFWEQIATQPWLRFFLFTAVTSAIFAAGLYTEHRWKLPTTSRGLLLIATLLVPLNFLAFSRGGTSASAMAIGQQLVALALFSWLVWMAGNVLAGRWSIPLVIGVLGPSIVQSAIGRFITNGQPAEGIVLLLALLAVAFYFAANAWVLASAQKLNELDWPDANHLLLLLGTSTFAVLLPLGVLAVKAQDWIWTTRQISPVLTLAAAPMLAIGLLLWRRVKKLDMAGIQTAGIAIAALAGFILIGGVVLAWPDPSRMLPAALVAFAALTAIALFYEIPQAHLLALPCLALVYILGFHLLQPAAHPHHIAWSTQPNLARALLSPTTGSSLLGLVLLLAVASDWLHRKNRPEARYYTIPTIAFAALSLVLVTLFGFAHRNDHGATWVYLAYALMAAWLAWRTDRSEATWIAIALLALAVVQALVFKFDIGRNPLDRWTLAALLHASILIAAMLLTGFLSPTRHEPLFIRPLSNGALLSAIAASALILIALLFTEPMPALTILALRSAWIATLLLAIAIVYISPALFGAFQIASTASVLVAVAAMFQNQPWFTAVDHPLLHPWTLQTAAIALAVLSLAWTIFRIILRRFNLSPTNRLFQLLNPTWTSIDSTLPYFALTIFLLTSLLSIAPAIAHELTTQSREEITSPSWLILHTTGPRAWTLFATTTLALLASLWIKFRRTTIISLLLALAGACAIAAATFNPQTSSASALRWLLAILLALASIPLLLRQHIAPFAKRLRWPDFEDETHDLFELFLPTLLTLTTLPILAITFYSAAKSLAGISILGPAPNSFFAHLGNSISYLVPLLTMILVFIAYAWRERSSPFAFAAALLLNITVTLGYMLHLVTGHHPIGPIQWIHLIQFNAIASATFALAWLAAIRAKSIPTLLQIQIAIPIATLLCLLALFDLQLILNPATLSSAAREIPGLFGCLAWLLSASAALWAMRSQTQRISAGIICTTLLIISSLAALRLVGAGQHNWLPYHALLAFTALSAWSLLGFGAITLHKKSDITPARDHITTWTIILASLTLFLSLRALIDDPTRPWWCVYGLLALSPLAIALAFWTMRSVWLYPAGILLNIALSIGWILGRHPIIPSPFLGLIQLNILILSLSGAALLLLELYILRPLRSQVVHVGIPAFHHFAAIVSLLAITFISFASLLADIVSLTATTNPLLTWAAPAAALALLLASLWDRDARYSLISLYVIGLAIAATVLHQFHLHLDNLAWLWVVIVAAYSVVVSYLYTFRSNLAQFAETISIPPRDNWPTQSLGWVGPITLLQSVLVFILAFFSVQFLTSQLERLAVAAGAISMAVAVGLLAHESRQDRLRRATLILGLFGAILWGWSFLPRFGPDVFLNRMVIVMVAMAAMSVLYAIGLVKILRRENDWTASARRLVPFIGIGTALSMVLVLVSEGLMYRPSLGAPMALWAFLAFALALLAMAAAAMVCAIVPGRDPLNLSEKARQAYVYATELLLVLLFVHIKLVYPDLLNIGIWTRFWPIIVMLLAFIGIGLSELFRRQGRIVLAEPLENTSLLLPILPVITFWLLTGVWKHEQNVNYALVLLLAGGAYGTLAMLRRSFIFGLLSALAGNGALWYLLSHSPSFGFFQHPQLWLIPIALSILAAAYLNRARLSPQHMRTIRYVCLMAIYASSTADIMINGINKSPALPMILALLAVAGVMAGIMLRVQSFLLLGTLFLLVAIATMIQYAAHQVGQNWPWLVAGILLGAAIIILFALFEKKRSEMLALVDGLKEWQG